MGADHSHPSKTALITGGGSGIGLALARAFAESGYSVIIAGRGLERLQAAATELKKTSASVAAFACDVRDPGSVEELLASISRQHATLDVLINNAGIAHVPAPVERLPVEAWREVIDTNLTGMFLITKAALPHMRAGGAIVNNLSVAAIQPFAGLAAYNASKFGAMGFTKALREELRSTGIRVIALLPGATDTDIWGQFWADAPRDKMISAATVAQAVLHAVSTPPNTVMEEIRIGPTAGVL